MMTKPNAHNPLRRLAMAAAVTLAAPSLAHAQETPAVGAHGALLPGTFTGVLPCADCDGIAYHLDLRPDQSFQMRQDWLGRGEEARRDTIGVWYADVTRGAIVLQDAGDGDVAWEVKPNNRLQLLDRAGNPIDSELNYALDRDAEASVLDVSGVALSGVMRYMADAAVFEACLTGRSYPIAQEGAYLALERAYTSAVDGGAPLYIEVEGALAMRPAMEGPDRQSLIVETLKTTNPEGACPASDATPPLVNTYWAFDTLMGVPAPDTGRSEPFLALLDTADARFAATIGCNRFGGTYTQTGSTLSFGPGMSTMMACPAPLDAAERALTQVIAQTHSVDQDGARLTLRDAEGAEIASLHAVYTPL